MSDETQTAGQADAPEKTNPDTTPEKTVEEQLADARAEIVNLSAERDTERDYFLTADESKDYGIVDQVISKRG